MTLAIFILFVVAGLLWFSIKAGFVEGALILLAILIAVFVLAVIGVIRMVFQEFGDHGRRR
jgi:hypothetical protein